MASSKPEFILVPGAWHGPESFKITADLITKAGYTWHSVTLPSVTGPPYIQSFDPDVQAIREVLDSVLQTGKDVVMIYHSYGGIPGSEALALYLKEQKEGWGKVLRLLYCASFILPEGGSLIGALQGKPLPWFLIDGDVVTPEDPRNIFYNDLTDDQAAPYVKALKPHAYQTFHSATSVAPWKAIPSTYIICTTDNAIPLAVQELMLSMAEGMGGRFDVIERCDAGHGAFASQPKWLAEKFIKAAGGDAL
ncbi:hypothetical protein B7494_g5846 [Chlorociboria aeruginascens]|nr:hypothetical protein B7494_g5846 [Chlorociboria aeruginascens]